MSLENYLTDRLNSEKTQERSKMFMDAMRSDDPETREIGLAGGIAFMATSFIESLEDFVLHNTRKVSDEELDEMIKSYYEAQGYEVAGSSHSWTSQMTLKKGIESLGVSVTNDSSCGVIFVTVSNWPY